MDIKRPEYNRDGTLTDKYKVFIKNAIHLDIYALDLGEDLYSNFLFGSWFEVQILTTLNQFKGRYIWDHWKWGTIETYSHLKKQYADIEALPDLKMNQIIKSLKKSLSGQSKKDFLEWNQNKDSLLMKCFYHIYPKILKFTLEYQSGTYHKINYAEIFGGFIHSYTEYIKFLEQFGFVVVHNQKVDALDHQAIVNMVRKTLRSRLSQAMKEDLLNNEDWKRFFYNYLMNKYKQIPLETMNLKTLLSSPVFSVREYELIKDRWFSKLEKKANSFLMTDPTVLKHAKELENVEWRIYFLSLINQFYVFKRNGKLIPKEGQPVWSDIEYINIKRSFVATRQKETGGLLDSEGIDVHLQEGRQQQITYENIFGIIFSEDEMVELDQNPELFLCVKKELKIFFDTLANEERPSLDDVKRLKDIIIDRCRSLISLSLSKKSGNVLFSSKDDFNTMVKASKTKATHDLDAIKILDGKLNRSEITQEEYNNKIQKIVTDDFSRTYEGRRLTRLSEMEDTFLDDRDFITEIFGTEVIYKKHQILHNDMSMLIDDINKSEKKLELWGNMMHAKQITETRWQDAIFKIYKDINKKLSIMKERIYALNIFNLSDDEHYPNFQKETSPLEKSVMDELKSLTNEYEGLFKTSEYRNMNDAEKKIINEEFSLKKGEVLKILVPSGTEADYGSDNLKEDTIDHATSRGKRLTEERESLVKKTATWDCPQCNEYNENTEICRLCKFNIEDGYESEEVAKITREERDAELIKSFEKGNLSGKVSPLVKKKKKKKKKRRGNTSPSSVKSSSSGEENENLEDLPKFANFADIKKENVERELKKQKEREKWLEDKETKAAKKMEKIQQQDEGFLETELIQEFLGMNKNTIEEFKSSISDKIPEEIEKIIMWDSILSLLIDLEYDILQHLDEPVMGILGGGFAAHLLTKDVKEGPYPTDDIDIKIYPKKKSDEGAVRVAREEMYKYLGAMDINIKNEFESDKCIRIKEGINIKMKKIGFEGELIRKVLISHMYSLDGELFRLKKDMKNLEGTFKKLTEEDSMGQWPLRDKIEKKKEEIENKKKEIGLDTKKTRGNQLIKITVDINRPYTHKEYLDDGETLAYPPVTFPTTRKAMCDIGFWKDGHMIPAIVGLIKAEKRNEGYIYIIDKQWLPYHEYKYHDRDINLPIIHKDNLIEEKKVLVEDNDELFNSQEAIAHKTPNWMKQRELLERIGRKQQGGRTLKRCRKRKRKKRKGVKGVKTKKKRRRRRKSRKR